MYDLPVVQALIVLWEASDRICGNRLKALVPMLAEALEKHGHLVIDSEGIGDDVEARLREIAAKLDPLRLLDEIRAMQHHLAALARGERTHTPADRHADLTEFLASLALARKAREVRPTHATKPRPARTWRSRKDPFEQVWPEINGWLEAEPDQIGVGLFARLQKAYRGRFPDGQLRTLQRRLADWRLAAFYWLVFRDLRQASGGIPTPTDAKPSA